MRYCDGYSNTPGTHGNPKIEENDRDYDFFDLTFKSSYIDSVDACDSNTKNFLSAEAVDSPNCQWKRESTAKLTGKNSRYKLSYTIE
jgi:hypothetical protein